MTEILSRFPKRLTFDTVPHEYQRIVESVRSGTTLRLDFGAVQKFDCASLALVIEVRRLCERLNVALSIDNVPVRLLNLARFCGVEILMSDKVAAYDGND